MEADAARAGSLEARGEVSILVARQRLTERKNWSLLLKNDYFHFFFTCWPYPLSY
jgi:hypothetical protein